MEYRSIYSKRSWYNNTLIAATVGISEGKITEVVPGKSTGAFDAGNSILMPGAIDAHVHVNEPGRTSWEGFETATKAAAKGGITTIIDMPLNALPVTTNVHALQEKLSAAENKLYVNCGFYGGMVPGNFDELQSLVNNGVLGVKCFLTHSGIDEFPNVDEKDLNRAMPLLAKNNCTLLVHCELLSNHISAVSQPGDYKTYLKSRPDKTEIDAIALMINLCRKHLCPVHIVHVSSAESLVLISKAKKEGLPLTAETCPHYLYFNAENITGSNTLLKCAPPIRSLNNNQILVKALANGVLDFISSDHSPSPPELKEMASGNIMKAWGGIAGLQFLLAAGWTACRNEMKVEEFIPLVTSRPAAFLGLHKSKGKIEIGFDADLVIWNPDETFIVLQNEVEHRHKITPYIGEKLFGLTETTIVNGEVVYNKPAKHTFVLGGKVILKERTTN